MAKNRYIKLSKNMSYLLRHRPEEGNLVLDNEGMVPIDTLLIALRQRRMKWVTKEDIYHVVKTSDKKRFQIEGERIGARYGHNRRVREVQPGSPIEPPEILYHGTPRGAVASILRQGLLSQGRQFVHLSATIDTAQLVGRRRDKKPTILRIRAREAYADGVEFYAPTAETYLARHVPATYIEEYNELA